MSRIAIIIESSNVIGETDLPGARVDQQNWFNFLTSELGGSWNESDIILLNKPFSRDVEMLLDKNKNKYCFVAFSGHGEEGHIALNDHYNRCPVTKLKPQGDKGTLIIDSCRGIDTSGVRNFSSAKLLYLAEASQGRQVIANSARGQVTKFASLWENKRLNHITAWLLALHQSGKGVVEMQACSTGESAGEDPNAGGYYTSLLLQSADLWDKAGGIGSIHTTKAAHEHAAAHLPPQQNPEYSPTNLAYPFAVSV